MKNIDLDTWNRREHFEFFSSFEDPGFGLVDEVECTMAYRQCKAEGTSFFATYLHRSLIAANGLEALRYRIVDGKPVLCDIIHAGPTIARDDGTFGFSFIPFNNNFRRFSEALDKEIEAVKNSTGLRKSVDGERINVIYFSTLPWIRFTALKHPFSSMENAGIPKITFGKLNRRGGRYFLPIGIEVHHGLLDGLHVAEYLKFLQEMLND